MAPTFQDLLFDIRDNVATITINRPEHANSFTLNTMKELSDAAIEPLARERAAMLHTRVGCA